VLARPPTVAKQVAEAPLALCLHTGPLLVHARRTSLHETAGCIHTRVTRICISSSMHQPLQRVVHETAWLVMQGIGVHAFRRGRRDWRAQLNGGHAACHHTWHWAVIHTLVQTKALTVSTRHSNHIDCWHMVRTHINQNENGIEKKLLTKVTQRTETAKTQNTW